MFKKTTCVILNALLNNYNLPYTVTTSRALLRKVVR